MGDELPRSGTSCVPGEDLYGLSVEELRERVSIYEAEIERLSAALTKKEQELSAADLIFKPKTNPLP